MDRRLGVTLIEVIFAIFIISAVALGIFSAVLQAQRLETASREKLAAQNEAKRVLEEIQATQFDLISATFGNYAFGVENLVALDGDADGVVGRVIVDSTNADLLNVTVEVEWQGAYPRSTVHFRTLIADK